MIDMKLTAEQSPAGTMLGSVQLQEANGPPYPMA